MMHGQHHMPCSVVNQLWETATQQCMWVWENVATCIR